MSAVVMAAKGLAHLRNYWLEHLVNLNLIIPAAGQVAKTLHTSTGNVDLRVTPVVNALQIDHFVGCTSVVSSSINRATTPHTYPWYHLNCKVTNLHGNTTNSYHSS